MASNMDILGFSDLLCGGLRGQINQSSAKLPILQRQGNEQVLTLEHIRDKNGNTHHPTTENDIKRGHVVRQCLSLNCFFCQKYLKQDGTTNYVLMTFRCKFCKMPICKLDHSGNGRDMSCLTEHSCSNDPDIRCHRTKRDFTKFPKHKQLKMVPASSEEDDDDLPPAAQ